MSVVHDLSQSARIVLDLWLIVVVIPRYWGGDRLEWVKGSSQDMP